VSAQPPFHIGIRHVSARQLTRIMARALACGAMVRAPPHMHCRLAPHHNRCASRHYARYKPSGASAYMHSHLTPLHRGTATSKVYQRQNGHVFRSCTCNAQGKQQLARSCRSKEQQGAGGTGSMCPLSQSPEAPSSTTPGVAGPHDRRRWKRIIHRTYGCTDGLARRGSHHTRRRARGHS